MFLATTLKTLGLQVHLGHGGNRCPVAIPAHINFTVMHTNGFHAVSVTVCDCTARIPLRQQLLRVGWYPATPHEPKSCATFELLRYYHVLSLQSKVSVHHFYSAHERHTDNTGLSIIPVCVLKPFGNGARMTMKHYRIGTSHTYE